MFGACNFFAVIISMVFANGSKEKATNHTMVAVQACLNILLVDVYALRAEISILESKSYSICT